MIRGFGSDNFSGVLPEVFKALEEAAYGHQHSYGEDVYSEKAIQDFKNVFGENIRVFFVYNGTGANIPAHLLLRSFLNHRFMCRNRPYQCGRMRSDRETIGL